MGEGNHTEAERDFLSRLLRAHTLRKTDVSRLLADPPATLRDMLVDKASRFFQRTYPALNDCSEDVAQDLLHELRKLVSEFKGRSTLRTFLIGVLHNKCRDRIRDAKRERASLWDVNPKTGKVSRFDAPSLSDGPLQQLLEKEADPARRRLVTSIRESIPQLMAALSQPEKRILQLRYGDPANDLGWDTIESVLNISSAAAKRTRDRLRDKIEKKWLPGLLRPVLDDFPNDGIDARVLLHRVCRRRSYDQTAEELRIDRKEVARRMRNITDLVMRFVAFESGDGPRTTHKSKGGQS